MSYKPKLSIMQKSTIELNVAHQTLLQQHDATYRFSFAHKVCPICNENKPVEEYHQYFSKPRNKYRIGNYCKPCAREESKVRSEKYFKENKEARLQYARDYRANPKNDEKRSVLAKKFKAKYREELKDCYVRDVLATRCDIPTEVSREIPEIVEAKRLQMKIRRKLKTLKNGKK